MKKFFRLGLPAIVLAWGMLVVGCDTEPDDEGDNSTKITITGLTGKDGFESMVSVRDATTGEEIAYRWGMISGSSVTLSLCRWDGYEQKDKPWTGSGSYAINFWVLDPSSEQFEDYYYTGGKTFVQLGISNPQLLEDKIFAKLPTCRIASVATTIDFNQFALAKNGNPKKTTITGLTGKNGAEASIWGGNTTTNESVYGWSKTISGDSVRFVLTSMGRPWLGSGSYAINLYVYWEDKSREYFEDYYYTGGKTWAQLGIPDPSDYDYEALYAKLPKYSFSSVTSTIPFNQFALLDSWSWEKSLNNTSRSSLHTHPQEQPVKPQALFSANRARD